MAGPPEAPTPHPTASPKAAKAAALRPAPAVRAPTPMMVQFQRAKQEAPGALLFFRMGDFFELFGEDAVVAARELGLTLTSRAKGEDALPMAGVPVRSVDAYLMKLVAKGFQVAICDQIQDPRLAKGIVDRAVVRIVTAGTITEEEALEARAPNYLACVHAGETRGALAWVDLSTGRFQTVEVELRGMLDEIARIAPAELLWPPSLRARHPEIADEIEQLLGPRVHERDEWHFDADTCRRALLKQLGVSSLEGFGIEDNSLTLRPAGALVGYLEETQKSACAHVRRLETLQTGSFVLLDRATRACLELVVTQREGRRDGTLIETIDATTTAMGGRLLREWLLAPLRGVEEILERQRGVAEFVDSPFLREEVRELLAKVADIERLMGKVSTARCSPRDLVALASSLAVLPPLTAKLEQVYSRILGQLVESLDPLEDVAERIRQTLVDAPPLALREGGLIRAGVHAELDELRQIAGDVKAAMAQFQAREIERTGMPNLKVGFNSVFGYYLEVPHGQAGRAPADYVRKQTVKNAERYITPELKDFETKVLQAEERSRDLEFDLFVQLRESVALETGRILDTARCLAVIDVLAALARKAAENHYCAPAIDQGAVIKIVDGRHPVIERITSGDRFVPNDTHLDRDERRIVILTGPNMGGKSTYIRQTALIVLLAQIGSFVPAKEAKIGVVDRIFTRVGAADDLGRGASTFMVEMVEVANILNHATARSLVVLDEVGRGTSTFDGLALAWAIVEHIHASIGCRTLFATHYHHLTELGSRLEGVRNMNVAVRDEIVFLHKIVEGGTDRSYGIHVARLAGLPAVLLERAREVLKDLEGEAQNLAPRVEAPSVARAGGAVQLGLFASTDSSVESELHALDPDQLTPMQALAELQRLKELLGGKRPASRPRR